jgi:ribosomal protein S18 acetylase RimI-like enzyme
MAAVQVRRATVADVSELVRLRGVMHDAMGVEHEGGRWQPACRRFLENELPRPTLAAYVADHPQQADRLAGCGFAIVTHRLASPRNPSGRHGYVQSMVVEPEFRRRGLARDIFDALMRWFADNDVPQVALHATADGEPLYRSFGFTEGSFPELRWHRDP